MMAKANIEAFAKAGEKNMFKNMFGGSDSDSDSDSDGDFTEKEQNDFMNTTHAATGSTDGSAMVNTDIVTDTDVVVYRSIHSTFEVLLHQEKRKGIAHQLWPAATFLSHYLEQNWEMICSNTNNSSSNHSSSSSSNRSSNSSGSNNVSSNHSISRSGSGTDQHDLINVIELGAGIGLCGLVCSKLHCNKVVLTDLPVAIPLLQTNIALNQQNTALDLHQAIGITTDLGIETTIREEASLAASTTASATIPPLPPPPPSSLTTTTATSTTTTAPTSGTVTAAVLSWGDKADADNVMSQFQPGQRVICIAADCVYWEVLFVPLFETLKTLVMEYHVEVIIAHVKRWKKDEKFFRMCKKCMNVEVMVESISMVPHEHTGVPTREVKRIYRIYRQCNTTA